MSKCADIVKRLADQLFKGKVTKKNLEDLSKNLTERAGVLRRFNNSLSVSDSFQEAANSFLRDKRYKILKAKQTTKLDALVLTNSLDYLKTFGKRPDKGLLSKVGVIQSRVFGSRYGLTQKIAANFKLITKGRDGWIHQLNAAEAEIDGYHSLMDVVADHRNKYEIAKGIAEEETVHNDYQKIGKIIRENIENRRKYMNSLGANIKKMKGYMFRRRHNRIAMTKIYSSFVKDSGWKIGHSFEEAIQTAFDKNWFPKVNKWINYETSFPTQVLDTLEKKRKALFGFYKNVITDIHTDFNAVDVTTNSTGRTPRKRDFYGSSIRSKHRILRMKGATEELMYQEEFGDRNLLDSLIADSKTDARNIGILKEFGPSYRTNFEELGKYVKSNTKGKVWINYSDKAKAIMDDMFENSNSNYFVSSKKFFSNQRAMTAMAGNGRIVIKALPDIALQTAAFRRNGMNFFENISARVSSRAAIFTKKADRELFMDYLGAGARDYMGHHVRYSLDSDVGGFTEKIAPLYYKATLMHPFDEMNRGSTTLALARRLGDQAKNSYKDLDPYLKHELYVTQIGEKEWELFRKHPIKDPWGKMTILPESILQNKTIGSFDKKDLASRMMAYFDEQEQSVVLTPGIGEKYFAKFGKTKHGKTYPSYIWWEVKNYLGMWKSFGIGMFTRVFAKELFGSYKGMNRFASLGALMAETSALNVISMMAYSISAGRTLPDFTKPKVIAEVITPGLGIAAMALKVGGNAYGVGTSFIKDATSTISQPIDRIGHIILGKKRLFNLEKLVESMTPLKTGWMGFGIVKHYFWDNLSEILNPGYIARSQRYMMKNYGQSSLY